MVYKTIKTSQGLQAFSTYTRSARSSVDWGTGRVTNYATTINLSALVEYPVGLPAGTAVPLIVCPSAGGFELINQVNTMDGYAAFVEAGAVLMSPFYRTTINTPWSDADISSDTAKKKAVRAARMDYRRFLEYVRQYPARVSPNYIIDPRRIFSLGWSSGGQQGVLFAAENPDALCGLVVVSGGMGLDGLGAQHTTDLRSFATEADLTPGNPPVLMFGNLSDATIGPPWMAALKAVVDADPASTALTQVGTGHADIGALNDVTYNGTLMTCFEAARQWMNEQMGGLSARMPSKFTWS